MATIVNQVCKFCNKTFTVKKGREKLFCSKECKSKHRAENDSKYYIEKPCEYCNVVFRSKKREHKKFCSYKCSGLNKYKTAREIKVCRECGNTFSERIKREKNFCSEICIRKWQSRPENIKIRLNKSKIAVKEIYGVDNTFMVDAIRLKAERNMRKTYQERGNDIIKNSLIIIEEKRQKKLIERFKEAGYKILEFCGENMKIEHPDGHIFENNRKLLVNRFNHNTELSTILLPIGSPRTTFELKICNFLKANNINYIPNDRKTINGELDINIPEYNLAVEVDGLHWHCEYYLNDDYHITKTKKCAEKSIQLLHFFEDELIEKYDIVESIIKNKLNIVNNKIFADNCIIKEISSKDSKIFLDSNHILGNINSSIKIGLFHDDELVSLMTFSKLRNVFGNKGEINGESEYELLRFCDELNTCVVGGADKLFNYFKLNYNPLNTICFANLRYDNGDLCKQLKFNYQYTTNPNYYYVVGKQRKHKFLFRKDVLVKEGFDANKTEHQIMLERKIPKIYDCGNIKYVYKID